MICALILAGAVSGMHWTAATGTSYTLIPNSANSATGKWTVIVVAVIVLPLYGDRRSNDSPSYLASSYYGLRFKLVGWRENEEIEHRKLFSRAQLLTQTAMSC